MKRILILILALVLMVAPILSSCEAFFGSGASGTPNTNTGGSNDETGKNENENQKNPNEGDTMTEQEKELAGWDDRFSVLEDKLSADAVSAIKKLYAHYDESVYEWLANLYDPQIGAFYYSNSARDYETFLPDLESTRQVLAIIRTSGMVNIYGSNNDAAFVSAFPEHLKTAIVDFVKGCQDEETGYFIHPQWADNTGTNRLGRDLDWAIELLNLFGEKPNYPTALDRLSGNLPTSFSGKGGTIVAVSKVQQTASLPSHLQSEEAFKKYLDGFNFVANSHDTGHAVGCQLSQIQAAGLLDFACDYFDEIQKQVYESQVASGETPSGLWQPEVNYTSLSGLYKIGALYIAANRSMNYLNECIDSAIKCIKEQTNPSVIIYSFNPWAGMQKAVSAIKIAVKNGDRRYDLEETYSKIRSECAALVDITAKQLDIFAKESGGFSYNQSTSAPTTQGTPVSLGFAEGDVNATNLAINSISGMIFSCMGLDRIPIWNSRDFEHFIEIIEASEPINKLEIKTSVIDFEDCNEGELPLGISADAPSGTREDDDGNRAMYFYSPASTTTKMNITTNIQGAQSAVAFETRIKLTNAQNGTTHQIKLRGARGNMYMITLKVNGNTTTISDSSHTGGGIAGTFKTNITTSEWTKLRFEVYSEVESPLAKNGFIVKIFVNDEFVGYSTNYFGPTANNPNALPTIGFTGIEIHAQNAPASELWLDDIFCESLMGKEFEEE